MINELAAQMTIEQLGWPTIEEIVRAKKLIDVYEKNIQRIKGNNKLKRKQKEYGIWLNREKEDHPDKCYCKEDGVEVERKYEKDGIIGHFTYFSHYDFYNEKPCEGNWYKCSNCGKKYSMIIAMA